MEDFYDEIFELARDLMGMVDFEVFNFYDRLLSGVTSLKQMLKIPPFKGDYFSKGGWVFGEG